MLASKILKSDVFAVMEEASNETGEDNEDSDICFMVTQEYFSSSLQALEI